jgi:hypothetical protein
MIEVFDGAEFLKGHDDGMFYVGFLKSSQAWFPLSLVSDPKGGKKLDSLFVSRSCHLMTDVVKSYAEQVREVEETFVQYLMPAEIANLMESYDLQQIAFIQGETDAAGGCNCGCGCG